MSLVAVALGMAWLLIGGTQVRNDLFDLVDRVAPGRGGGSPAEPIGIVGAQAFDPVGGDGENSAEAPLAIDGDPATAWRTERYDSRAFGGLKDGVGIFVDLGEAAHLEQLVVGLHQ